MWQKLLGHPVNVDTHVAYTGFLRLYEILWVKQTQNQIHCTLPKF